MYSIYTDFDVTGLKTRYIKAIAPTIQYVKLFLELKETNTLYDVTKITQGSGGKILKKKTSLGDIKDIFDYQNKPCAQLIVMMGGPGKY